MIRQAIPNDANCIAKLVISGWQTAYKGLIDSTFLNNMSFDIMSKNWRKYITSQNNNNHIFVYEKDNQILGIIRFGELDDQTDTKHNAEIYVLYVEPNLKRHGIGSKLFNFAKDYFVKANLTDMIVWCLKENIPTIKFYEAMGGKIIGNRKTTVHNIEIEETGLTYKLNKITIEPYQDIYAKAISKLIIKNLLEINSKDYNMEYIQKYSKDYTVSKIKKIFQKRTKVFVALEDDIVVGTAGLDKSWYNDDGEYWILTVFVDVSHHKKNIGKRLINEVEKYAQNIDAKKLVVPASITACEFYHKFGYEYKNGKKELNKEQLYIMEKLL